MARRRSPAEIQLRLTELRERQAKQDLASAHRAYELAHAAHDEAIATRDSQETVFVALTRHGAVTGADIAMHHLGFDAQRKVVDDAAKAENGASTNVETARVALEAASRARRVAEEMAGNERRERIAAADRTADREASDRAGRSSE